MLISHEVPKILLEKSLEFNDYQFVLPYFYNRDKTYKEFMLNYKGFKILDCGLFEGETYSKNEYISLINELKPDVFIIPDEWNNSRKTHEHAANWSQIGLWDKELKHQPHLMVVLQGKTLDEMIRLMKNCIRMGIKYFGVNHSSVAYDKEFPNNPQSKMLGRIKLIYELQKVIGNRSFIHLHLLGCTYVQEFMYYKDIEEVKSVDTSNPILLGMNGVEYNEFEFIPKPNQKMEEFFNEGLDSNQTNIIFKNINKFKKYANS